MLAPELPPPPHPPGRPAGVVYLRLTGLVVVAAFLIGTVLADPQPGLSGDGLGVTACLVALVLAFARVLRTKPMAPGHRLIGLLVVAGGSIGLILLQQQQSSAIAGIYFAVVVAAIRLRRREAFVVLLVAVGGGCAAYGLGVPDDSGQVLSILLGVPPWFFVMRVMIAVRRGQADAQELVEELQASREAQAAAAADAERTRVAREMHDVLAHSLAGLTIQLEAARVLAARGDDAQLAGQVERAHELAVEGLDEARRAIGALRGDALPGPERLPDLVEAFTARGGPAARLEVRGEERPLGSEARLAIYRTAQEALTNVTRHARDAETVEVCLGYEADGVRLVVEDRGAVPAAVGGASPGGGYGLTGMRERAELLGGSLQAASAPDGFRVELWLTT